MDELLTTFRSDVPEPDPETARRIYALATRSSRTRIPRRRLVLTVAVAALVLVPTAVAFGGKLADLFEGTPAPPSRTEWRTRWCNRASPRSGRMPT